MALPLSAQRSRHYGRSAQSRAGHATSQADSLCRSSAQTIDSLQLLADTYRQQLEALMDSIRRKDSVEVDDVTDNPYYYPMLLEGTLYDSPLQQQMGVEWCSEFTQRRVPPVCLYPGEDDNLVRHRATNDMLSRMYVSKPWLFRRTQAQISQAGGFIEDMKQTAPLDVRLSDNASMLELDTEIEPVVVQTHRPNFWKFNGNGSINFTQSYFSENWYQGGENNYSALTQLTLNLKFDNKQKIQWENRLEAQLGFQTSKSDTHHDFKPTSNLIRLTSKLGYQAAKHWYYTGQVQTWTQIVKNYDSNSDNVTTDIFSPLHMVISMGLDYKFNLKRFSGSVYIAPLAYNMKYVQRAALATRYGVDEGEHSKHTFGPNININYTLKLAKNISWRARFYWFSNFDYTDIQFENTIEFNINKYLNTKFFFYPKFDDSAPRFKGKKDYFMMKEWLSLGVNYNI